MDPNLTIKSNQGFKHILLRKLSCAVVASISVHVLLLFLYLFCVNLDILHPLQWITVSLRKLTSFYTWVYIIPFSTIIFAQAIICAKDYVIIKKYSTTRFWNAVSIFSIHNFILMTLHIISGGLVVWLYLALTEGKYGNFIRECPQGKVCLIEGKLYLLLSGFWSGLYYFIKMYSAEKKIMFPVVYQHKWLQFKTVLLPTAKQCCWNSFAPNIYFYVFYFVFESAIKEQVMAAFGVHNLEVISLDLYMWALFFTTLYFIKMKLMSLFFELFLTEPVYFPIESVHKDDLILSNAIGVGTVPVIQHLACYDLYTLSCWCPSRRKQLFTLSQPGGHPHNWNNLIEAVLKILAEFTQELNKSTLSILEPEKSKPTNIIQPVTLINSITSPTMVRNRNIRNMAYFEQNPIDIINISQNQVITSTIETKETLVQKITERYSHYVTVLKSKLGFNYLFGELPEANIQYCLDNGQIIIWTTQGISSLITHALEEDDYGVVQKDLPVIVTTLVELKLSLEKLNRIPSLTRKGLSDYNVKMKSSVNAAVKRSIFNICKDYGQYFRDLNIKKEILQYCFTVVNSRHAA